MKIAQLLEDDQEPLVTTILRNALAKGKQVRVYYKGDGGHVTEIAEWDAPADAARHRARDLEPGHGVTSFKLVDGRWIVIGDQNIDKLVLSKRVENGVEVLTLKHPPAPIREGTTDSRDWVNLQDAEFKQLITDAGWMLKKPPVYGMEHGFFGGTIRATAKAVRSMLTLDEQRRLIMKLIGKKLIKLCERGLICTVAPYNVQAHAGSLQIRPHTTMADIIDTLENGMHLKHDGTAFDAYWSVRVPKDIVDSTAASFTNIFRKMEGDTDEDE